MNWPIQVATGGGKVVLADAYNDRVLIWNTFPSRNGQPADLVLRYAASPGSPAPSVRWPWGVWTDGTRLVVSCTGGGGLLIWSSFPTQADQPPDLYLRAQSRMGTPRTVTSDGRHLIVGDHNAGAQHDSSISFVWTSWPETNDAPPDFTLDGWLQADFTVDGELLMVSTTDQRLLVWDGPPTAATRAPSRAIGGSHGFRFIAGDGSGVAVSGGRVYISLSNGNRIVGYHSLPEESGQVPDFVVGSPTVDVNPLDSAFIISNPVVATDGRSLFVSSDFDRRLYVWARLPDRSNAYPDWVFALPDAPWDNALSGRTLALAGKQTVFISTTLPVAGELRSRIFQRSIGPVQFRELAGVALDDRYFYLADAQADRIYAWRGLPAAGSAPALSLSVTAPGRLHSDGEHLVAITDRNTRLAVWRVADLSASNTPAYLPGRHGDPVTGFNLPGQAMVRRGALFLGDTGFNRVLIRNRIADALAGRSADVVLGATSLQDVRPEIGRDRLFWPSSLAFDGSYLWVGEFKFSERLLRFSVR